MANYSWMPHFHDHREIPLEEQLIHPRNTPILSVPILLPVESETSGRSLMTHLISLEHFESTPTRLSLNVLGPRNVIPSGILLMRGGPEIFWKFLLSSSLKALWKKPQVSGSLRRRYARRFTSQCKSLGLNLRAWAETQSQSNDLR